MSARARQGAAGGLVVVAEGQSRGRGRRGTSWSSPARRGLYVSVLLRQDPGEGRCALLSPALAVATARAVSSLGIDAGIKWPNDVVAGGLKIAGCLVDVLTAEGQAACAVLGVGINADFARDDLVADGPLPAGSLSLLLGRPVDREALLARLLREMDAVTAALAAGHTADLLQEFRARDALAGAHVVAREGDRVIEGEVLDADPVSGVLVHTPEGPVRLRAEHTHLLRVRLRT